MRRLAACRESPSDGAAGARLAVGRVGKPDRRRRGIAAWPVVADVSPQAPVLVLPLRARAPGPAYVGVQLARGQHVAAARRPEAPADGSIRPPSRPAWSDRGRLRRAHRFPTGGTEGVVRILRNEHVCQQARPGETTLDRTARRGSLHDVRTATATQLRPDDPDHFELCRHEFEKLRDVLAKLRSVPPPFRTRALLGRVRLRLTRQVLRQRTPCGLSSGGCAEAASLCASVCAGALSVCVNSRSSSCNSSCSI